MENAISVAEGIAHPLSVSLVSRLIKNGNVVIVFPSTTQHVYLNCTIILRYLIRTTSCGELVAEVAFAGIERFPLVLTGILIALTATTGCGELSLILGAFCQFLHLFSMYKVCSIVHWYKSNEWARLKKPNTHSIINRMIICFFPP